MFFAEMRKPAWRNGLARWTSNPKVVGSNPTVGVLRIARKTQYFGSGNVSKHDIDLNFPEIAASVAQLVSAFDC